MATGQTVNGQPAVYNATPPTLEDGQGAKLQVDSAGNLKISAVITGSDIQIGSVELKDSDSAALANIKAANTARTTATVVVATQHIDAAGVVGGVRPSAYATDDSAMPATPAILPVGGEYRSSATTYADGDAVVDQVDVNGNKKTTLATAIAGEDLTNDVMKVEQRFSGVNVTADALVKSGAGFLHTITIMPTDTAATAGTIILYDNTAESGTLLGTIYINAAGFIPFTLTFDCSFATGLYIGFTTTNDVNVTVSYR